MTLAERARKMKEISPLMTGREKLETKDVVGHDLTIAEADIVSRGTSDAYAVVVFAEEPDKFLYGGLVLTKLIEDLMAQLEAEGLTLADELAKEDAEPLKIRMVTRRSKGSKRDYTDVEVL